MTSVLRTRTLLLLMAEAAQPQHRWAGQAALLRAVRAGDAATLARLLDSDLGLDPDTSSWAHARMINYACLLSINPRAGLIRRDNIMSNVSLAYCLNKFLNGKAGATQEQQPLMTRRRP